MCLGYMQVLHHFRDRTWVSADFGISEGPGTNQSPVDTEGRLYSIVRIPQRRFRGKYSKRQPYSRHRSIYGMSVAEPVRRKVLRCFWQSQVLRLPPLVAFDCSSSVVVLLCFWENFHPLQAWEVGFCNLSSRLHLSSSLCITVATKSHRSPVQQSPFTPTSLKINI